MNNLKPILLIIPFFFIISCDKEGISNRPMNQAAMWNCHNKSSWDATKISDELVGRWQWIYTENYWAPEEGRNTENEKMEIDFFNDSTLQITVNGEPVLTTSWKTVPEDGELYGLELESSVSQLHGRILICSDIVEFNNSYIDGSDNYFRRIK